MLTRLDQWLIEDRNTWKQSTEEAEKILKRSSSSVGLDDSSRKAPFSQTESSTSRNPTSSYTACPPKLTDRERKYLKVYNRCKKCGASICPTGTPVNSQVEITMSSR
jgi:hypothetical protein